jgi:type II secretory pathway pseudopilin PulG
VSVVAIVLIALAALILLLLLGGYVAARRRNEARSGRLLREVAAANEALAAARAGDRGWDRDTIDAAARAAHLARRPGADISAVHLTQVVDRPGTDEDQARLHVVDHDGDHEVVLGRRGGEWGPTA